MHRGLLYCGLHRALYNRLCCGFNCELYCWVGLHCGLLQVPALIENGHLSRLFTASFAIGPDSKHKHFVIRDYITDYCGEGTPWRKRTRLRCVHLDLSMAVRHCSGCRGVCSFSGLPHLNLRGLDKGQFRTLTAQPYPHSLCRRLVTSYVNAIMSKKFEIMSAITGHC